MKLNGSLYGDLCYRVFYSLCLLYSFSDIFIFMYAEALAEALDVQNQHAFQIAKIEEWTERRAHKNRSKSHLMNISSELPMSSTDFPRDIFFLYICKLLELLLISIHFHNTVGTLAAYSENFRCFYLGDLKFN